MQLFDQQGLQLAAWPQADRAWQFGDGVFRTALIVDGGVVDLRGQLQTLFADASRIGLSASCTLEQLSESSAVVASSFSRARLKWILSAGDSDAGYARRSDTGRVLLSVARLPENFQAPPAISSWVCETQWGRSSVAIGCKHLNRLEQVLARAERDPADWPEGLVCDSEGHLCSGIMSNLFWEDEDGRVHTDPLPFCGVHGRTRTRLSTIIKCEGRELVYSQTRPEVLFAKAREVVICNSLWGVVPIASCAGWTSASQKFCQWLGHELGHPISPATMNTGAC